MLGELRIRMFGGFRAEAGGQAVEQEAWRRSGATALVKLLALTRGHRMHREQVIDTLWPELSQSAGAGRLNKALHFARRALGAEHVLLRDDLLSLHAEPLWIDVDDFEQAAQTGDTARALDLYRGDLLPENRFDLWAEARRDQLRAVLVRILLDQGAQCEAAGQLREAAAACQRVIEIDPLHEQAHAHLIRLEAAQGLRQSALRRYDRLAAGLRDELGVEPGADLQSLHADLLAGRLAPLVTPATAAATSADAGLAARGDTAPPQPAAPVTGPAVVEERKLVTVLVADLHGAQPDADPERARRELTAWAEVLCEVAGRWGGKAQRVIGGGVVAVFGYPEACEDHAARALWAGFEMLQRLSAPVRIGVDTGEIIALAGGGSLADVGGEVLHTAGRLREAATPRQVLVAERTRRAARRGGFRFGRAVSVARATGAALMARRLLSAMWAAEGQPQAEPPMVGRDDELRAVTSLIDETAASGQPRLLTVAGVAGVGKSRLVREAVSAALRRRPETRVLRGRCLPAGDGITYWALAEILRDACGIALGEAGEVARGKLRRHLEPLLAPHLRESEVDATVFALATTAAIAMPGNPLDTAIPRIVAEELAAAWPRFVSASARRGPLILLVEDLHWAGAPLLEMLARLASRAGGPVVLLTTARPEFLEEHPWFGTGSGGSFSLVSLRSLTEAASRELVAGLPGAERVDAQRREEILQRADGNPYFLDQLVAHVADGGSGVLPDSIHATLAARVDRLPAAEKQLLQAAAVVGRTFWVEPVRARLGGDVAKALAALEDRGLIHARQLSSLTGQTEFAFRHALLRDVAYASLPAGQRADGHAETAAWLEETSRERVGEVIELIAFHYSAAADAWAGSDVARRQWVAGKAFRSLIEAGASARHRNAVSKALALHRQAQRYAAGVGDHAEAWEAIGDDHEVVFDGDDAVAAWQTALELLRPEPSHVDRRVGLCFKIGQMVVMRWGGFLVPPHPRQADLAIEEGLTVVTDPSLKAHLLSMRALTAGRWSWGGLADPVSVEQRRSAAESARLLAVELGSPALQSMALMGLTAVQFVAGDHEGVTATVLELVDQAELGARPRDLALACAVACLVIGDVKGDRELALRYAVRSHELSRDLSPHDRMHGTYMVMSCLEQLGRWRELEPYLQEHLELLAGPASRTSCPYIRGGHLVAALALVHLGDTARAQQIAELMPADPRTPGKAETLRAELALELGDLAAARSLVEPLVRQGRGPGPEEIPHELTLWVEILEAQGDFAEIQRFVPQARAKGAHLAAIAPICDRAEGLARAAAGDVAAAAELLTGAVAAFGRIGMPLRAARTLEQLAALMPERAGELRRSALETYTRLGATADAARLSRH